MLQERSQDSLLASMDFIFTLLVIPQMAATLLVCFLLKFDAFVVGFLVFNCGFSKFDLLFGEMGFLVLFPKSAEKGSLCFFFYPPIFVACSTCKSLTVSLKESTLMFLYLKHIQTYEKRKSCLILM